MPEELTAKNKIEILSVLYGPYGCTALFVSGITSSIGKKECEAMQKAIASALDGDMEPRPNLRAPRITPNDADCKGCPERQNQGLVWSAKPPTVPGWYWWREKDRPEGKGIIIYTNDMDLMYCADSEEWAGPSPIPEEAVS